MFKSKILILVSGLFLALLIVLSSIQVVYAELSLFDILTTTLGFDVNPVTIESIHNDSLCIVHPTTYWEFR